MPITFSIEQQFAAPPDRVFETLIDLDTAPTWLPGLIAIERQEPGPLAVGHSWKETRRMMGKEASEYLEVTALEAPSRLGLRVDGTRGSSGRGEYLFDYTIEPQGEGSNVTLVARIDGMGRFMMLLGRLFAVAYRRAVAKDLVALRARLDGEVA